MYEIEKEGCGKWVAGSTLCLNLRNINKIPAFYNPQGARGEDTFFSTKLDYSKVYRIPVYHFHDGFLMYTGIMNSKFPKKLEKIDNSNKLVEKRFFSASVGWIRYKPLLMYILDKKNYRKNIEKVRKNLENCILNMKKAFTEYDFSILIKEFDKYSQNVKKDYIEYKKTNEVWNKLKK